MQFNQYGPTGGQPINSQQQTAHGANQGSWNYQEQNANSSYSSGAVNGFQSAGGFSHQQQPSTGSQQKDEWYSSQYYESTNAAQPPPANAGGYGFKSAIGTSVVGQTGSADQNAFSPAQYTSTGFEAPLKFLPPDSGDFPANYDDEPPLLTELGVNFDHIKTKTAVVLIPTKEIKADILHDTDMAGPLVFCLVQGFFLLFSGKIFFGYVFGFGFVGCLAMYCVINLMNHAGTQAIDLYRVFSALGYCLLPIVLLSAVTVILNLSNVPTLGLILTSIAVLWCTQTATRFFEAATQMSEQRYLIAYPVFLLYACFALITVL